MDKTTISGIAKIIITAGTIFGAAVTDADAETLAGAWAVLWTIVSAIQAKLTQDKATD